MTWAFSLGGEPLLGLDPACLRGGGELPTLGSFDACGFRLLEGLTSDFRAMIARALLAVASGSDLKGVDLSQELLVPAELAPTVAIGQLTLRAAW